MIIGYQEKIKCKVDNDTGGNFYNAELLIRWENDKYQFTILIRLTY